MMQGVVTEQGEAILSLRIASSGSLPSATREVRIEAVIDTGFTEHLMFGSDIAAALNLSQVDFGRLVLADGSVTSLPIYEAVVQWHDEEVVVPAYVTDTAPLIGVAMLRGSVVTMEFIEGGVVSIEEAD